GGNQCLSWDPTLYQPFRCGSLNHGALTSPTAILRPVGNNDSVLSWDGVEPRRGLLADGVHASVAARANGTFGFNGHVNPRQVRWQRSAVSLPNLFLGRWAVSRCLDCRLLLFFRLLFCERGFYILDGEQQLIAISTAQ